MKKNAWRRLIFNRRPMWLVIIAALTLYFGFEMTRIKIDARFEKMLPMQHEYLQNMFSRLDDLTQKGLSFKIAIENTQGDIFDKEYSAGCAECARQGIQY
jgi:predicted RND superfamily exporter protein